MEQTALRIQRWVQRLGSGLLAFAVVWSIGRTANAASAKEAATTLWQDLALTAVRWQLGDKQDGLSPTTALTIGQSAFLEVARPAVLQLWTQDEAPDTIPDAKPATIQKEPVVETPILQPTAPNSVTDNGVEALTLTPSGSRDYLVYDNVYISSSADVTVTPEDLDAPFAATLGDDAPQILILHTHATEAYTPADSNAVTYYDTMRTLDTPYSVVAVGQAMTAEFEAMGISVLHDTTLYDYPSYSDSYPNALSAIQQHLADHPSISFVIDVHRDAIEDGDGNQYKLLTDPAQGDSLAQLTLVMGTDGGGLEHPHWLENLRFATALQSQLDKTHPTLMRPLLLRNSRYNQHMTTGSLLLEVGAAGNSPEEAIAAGVVFAQEMGEILLT